MNSKLKIQEAKYKIPHFLDKPFKLGLDLQGGAHLLYQADLSKVDQKDKGAAMEGLREPETTQIKVGRAEIRQVFRVSKAGNVAGCMVLGGKIVRGGKEKTLCFSSAVL